jgi:hypothetical protein
VLSAHSTVASAVLSASSLRVAAPTAAPVRIEDVVRQVDLLGETSLQLVAGMLDVPAAQLEFVWRRAIDEGYLSPAGDRHRTTPLAWILLAA